MRNSQCSVLFAVLLFAVPAVTWAGDGRIEVNQATITAAGGFPYTLSGANGASYVLTSDIVVPSASMTGLVVAAGVTLDLNGFAVRGPVTCSRSSSYEPSTTTCTEQGAGMGVSLAPRSQLRNGRVTGMGSYCIYVQTTGFESGPTIENVYADNCAGGGVRLYGGTLRDSNVTNNGGEGVSDCYCGGSGLTVVVERNVIAFNKGHGTNVQGTIRENRISYNGGAGVKTLGTAFVVGNDIQSNDGRGIEIGNGGYLENRVVSNATTPPGQVSGGTNIGGNLIQ